MNKDNTAYRVVTAATLKPMFGCLVYGWFRGERCLYIGATSQGLRRLLNHNVIGKVEPIQEQDTFRFWAYEGEDGLGLYHLELALQRQHQPKYGLPTSAGYGQKLTPKICLQCRREFQPKRHWQVYCCRNCGTGNAKATAFAF